MFNEFRFENFKSHRASALPLAPLTLMIGTNASGKTNALEGIRFLSWLSEGIRLEDIVSDVREINVSIRGSLADLGTHGSHTFTLGCSQSEATVGPWRHFEIEFRIGERDLQIVDERLWSDESTVPLYAISEETKAHRYEVQVEYNNFARGGIKPRIPCSNRRPIFTQLDTPSRFKRKQSQERIPRVTEQLRTALEQIIFLDPNPAQMREYSPASDTVLSDDGKNLSGVLHHLCETEGRKSDVLDFIRHLPEQDILNLRFIETERGDVMAKVVESFGDRKTEWDAPMLSDGTLRVLAVAAAVLSAPEGSLIAVEEIDNGIHPSRAGSLLKQIQSVAENRNLRVLLTSHNPALLDSLPNNAVPHVVCCYRDPESGDSKLVRLEELRKYPELVARGPLGRLMTDGVIEQFVRDRTTEEEEIARNKDWFQSFREELKVN